MPKVDVVSAYRFHMFELAHQIENRGALGTLYTVMPKKRITEVSKEAISSRSAWALMRFALERFTGHSKLLNRTVVRSFDNWVTSQNSGSDISIYSSSFATNSLIKRHRQGIITVLDRGAQHIVRQKEILEDEHNRLNLQSPLFDDWLIQRELIEYETADQIVVPSKIAKTSYVESGINSEKVIVIPYGVNLSKFSSGNNSQYLSGKVLSVGSITPQKGQQFVLPAYRSVRNMNSSLHLIGGIEDKEFIKQLDLESDEDVLVTGPISGQRVAEYMRQCSFFTLMSVHDGFGMVVPQAMASGLAVVVSSNVGAADLVIDGYNGFVVKNGDIQTLAKRFNLLLENPELCRELGKNALETVSRLSGWDSYGQEYWKLLQSL